MFHNHKHIKELKSDGRDDAKFTGDDCGSVILEKG